MRTGWVLVWVGLTLFMVVAFGMAIDDLFGGVE